MNQDVPLVKVGDVIAGRYRVERVLGQGAMGMVVAVMHTELHERRAIKFMLPSQLDNPEGTERFLREARACAKLKSKHVATVYDVGRLDNNAQYIVMEYLEGTDLKDLLKLRPVLPLDEAVRFLLQACEAIGEAHLAGIVHRDLKPANMFLTAGVAGAPCIKVLDFGIAKWGPAAGIEQQDMTATAAIMGSPLYMSPEQIRSSRSVDARADIWSVGVILYRMVTGQLPFQAPSAPELFVKIFSDTANAPSKLNPRLPKSIDSIILKCLEKSAENRWQNIDELVGALSPYLDPQTALDGDATTPLGPGSVPQDVPSLSALGKIRPPLSSSPGGTVVVPLSRGRQVVSLVPSLDTIQGLGPVPTGAEHEGVVEVDRTKPHSPPHVNATVVMTPEVPAIPPSTTRPSMVAAPPTASTALPAPERKDMAEPSADGNSKSMVGAASARPKRSQKVPVVFFVGVFVAFLGISAVVVGYLALRRGETAANDDKGKQKESVGPNVTNTATAFPPKAPPPTPTIMGTPTATDPVANAPVPPTAPDSPQKSSVAVTNLKTTATNKNSPTPTTPTATTATPMVTAPPVVAKPPAVDIFGDGKR